MRRLRVSDWIEVRSKEEILATLDSHGCLDRLPFMPEMFAFCGRRFQVFKRAHKTCDTVHKTGGRKLARTVHLAELRCDGEAHGGCQAGCLLFWKEAWLRRVSRENPPLSDHRPSSSGALGQPLCTEAELRKLTLTADSEDRGDPVYVCQATKLPEYTAPLAWWDPRQYLEDYLSGNVRLRRLLAAFFFAGYRRLMVAGIGLGRVLRGLYRRCHRLAGAPAFPFQRGRVGVGQRTPTAQLNLQPGEWVQVKPLDEILDTLDQTNRNRGLYFDVEEVPFCGGRYRVLRRVHKIINEQTGRMTHFKTGAVILEGVYCQARYSDRRLCCPRSIYSLWREVWLERVGGDAPVELRGR